LACRPAGPHSCLKAIGQSSMPTWRPRVPCAPQRPRWRTCRWSRFLHRADPVIRTRWPSYSPATEAGRSSTRALRPAWRQPESRSSGGAVSTTTGPLGRPWKPRPISPGSSITTPRPGRPIAC
jgi:hypothetical protein